MAEDILEGLGAEPRKDWPAVTEQEVLQPAIERLAPRTSLHEKVLNYLLERLETSERQMSQFYARWEVNEKKVQGYIKLSDYEKVLKAYNDEGQPPKITSIVVPYSFAALSTLITYQLHTFTGRKPILQVGTYSADSVQAAAMMETVMQFNADHTRLVRHIFQFLQDAHVYGLGVIRTAWKEQHEMRTIWKQGGGFSLLGMTIVPPKPERVRELRLVYQGNEAFAQDPFMFFPDPRVPIVECAKRGEFVFWRNYEGRHMLKRLEADGVFKHIDAVGEALPTNDLVNTSRSLVAGGASVPGMQTNLHQGRGLPRSFAQLDQGSIEIIPAELGLGPEETPVKWVFTIANKKQIIQAEPLGLDHNSHPICVTEPFTLGYGFGQLGMIDYLANIQDTLSWLINSHMDNVRRFLNDMIVYDPSMIEEQDLKRPGPGKLIRLKRSALGIDVKTAVQQLQIQDVTGQHMRDAEVFFRIGELLSAATENLMGRQAAGGRKTATEARIGGESAASRLAATARLISAQALVELAEQWSLNTQQLQEQEFYLQLVGQEGIDKPIQITPEMLVGDFHYPIHDGTLPIDKVATLDVWRQIFQAIQADPELRANYSLPRIFEFLAEMGGAKNIESMKIKPDEQMQAQVQAGNAVPIDAALQQLGTASGKINATEPNPGRRMAM